MKNLTLQLRLASLLSLILLACTAAYGQLTPSGDSYTNTAAATTNYGAKTTLDVESKETTFIQFNLESIPTGYTGSEITKATLKLYVDAVTTAGSFNVDYVNGTWTESTIDASNAPALGTTIAASVPLTTADKNQYILVDITAAVQAWLSGTPNDGIALVANSPLSASFDSKEATKTSHTAELDVVFAGGGGSGITGITTAAGSGLIGGGTSGTLNLSLTNTCAASQILQWNGSAWACASPGTGTITGVTAGTDLLGGGTSGNVTLSLNTAATNALYAQLGAGNTFTTNQTVDGTITASSSGTTISGITSSTSLAGVAGYATASTGSTFGVFGQAASPGGWGVAGTSPFAGVVGFNGGYEFSTAGAPYGVIGDSPSVGVYGASSGVSNTGSDVYHTNGVWGDYGSTSSPGAGVLGTADNYWGGGFTNSSSSYPSLLAENNTNAAGGEVFIGVIPYLENNGTVLAIIGDPGCGAGFIALQLSQSGMSNCNNYTLTGGTNGETYLNAKAGKTVHLRVNNTDALVASGSGVSITGTLSATGTKNFRIDHPLDPANKYLTHAAIESSEVLNLYSGNVTLDDSGAAVVQLPDWFEAVNKDFRYQLTPIGAPGQGILYIAEEVSGGHFKIAGGKPGAKVSWQVTGVRNDAWEKAYPMVVEADKGADRGHYLTPELYGQPATARIGYEAVPPEAEQVVHHERTSLLRGNASPARAITLPAPAMPVLPKAAPSRHVAPLHHPPAQAGKLQVNQK